MLIKQIVTEAFEAAKQKAVDATTDQERNRQRSIIWVESLASAFREYYQIKDNYRVFSKYYEDIETRKDFGLNELLYDISVCKINYTESPKHKTKLAYIEKALWLVESEMAKDTRQLVYDFNKLLIGDAENKLFVGPINTYNKEQIEIFKKIALNCKGNVWVAMIPHPGEWKKTNLNDGITIKKL